MEIEFKNPSITRIQNEALGRRETPPVIPKQEVESEDDENSEYEHNYEEQGDSDDETLSFEDTMQGLFVAFPLLKNPDSTKVLTSDKIWKVFSRSINRVMSAGYLNKKEIIDKFRPGHEDYAKNQFIYVRHIYSGMFLARFSLS